MLKKISFYCILMLCNKNYTMQSTSQLPEKIDHQSDTIVEVNSWVNAVQAMVTQADTILMTMRGDVNWINQPNLQTASNQLVQRFSQTPQYKELVQNPDDSKTFLTFKEVFFTEVLSPIFLNNVKEESYADYLKTICLANIALKNNIYQKEELQNLNAPEYFDIDLQD